MAIIRDFTCKCCHQRKDSKEQINTSGYCIQCYGSCILTNNCQCDIIKSSTKFKLHDEGYVVIDEVSELTPEIWSKL